MFKKFLNAILFGALILGSAGTITSCKDYDDEIDEINQKLNNLSSKDELAAQVSSLTSTISAAQAAAAQASTEAANALTAAKEAAAQAEQAATGAGQATGQAAEAITNAKAAATTADAAAKTATEAAAKAKAAAEDAAKAVAAGADATKAIAEAKAAAEAAKKAAEEAKAGVSAAQKAATDASATAATAAQKAVADAQKAIAEAAQKTAEAAAKEAAAAAVKTELGDLTKRIEALEKGGSSVDPEALEEIQKAVDEAKKAVNDIVGKISTAVTSVSIVDSYTASQVFSSITANSASYTLDVTGQGTVANFYYELLIGKVALNYLNMAMDYSNEHGSQMPAGIPGLNLNMKYDLDLDFTTIVEKADWTAAQGWGKWMEEYSNEKPFDFYGIGADLKNALTFKKDQLQPRGDYFVVRVSPTNAVLEPSQIQLVNSLGQNMNEFLNYDVRPFEGKLSRIADVNINTDLLLGKTRAEGDTENTGLWIVKATMKKGLTPEQLAKFDEMTVFTNDIDIPGSIAVRPSNYEEKAITRSTVNLDDATNETQNTSIATVVNKYLFAVQVNNTAEDAADRFVTSSYDLTMGTSDFRPANRLHFSVNGNKVETLNNRFDAESESFYEGYAKEQEYEERVWLADTVDVKPAIRLVGTPAAKRNAFDRSDMDDVKADEANSYGVGYSPEYTDSEYMDDRHAMPYLTVAPGEKFTISLDANQGWATMFDVLGQPTGKVNVKPIPTAQAVRAMYVVLDQPNAVESIPSEWNAWLTYNYTGINEVVEGTSVEVSVDGEELVSKNGDIIGFRVYAINWDGTLVDPDGRAFYIKVANEAETDTEDTVIYPVSDQDFFDVAPEDYPTSEPVEFTFNAKSIKKAVSYKWEAKPLKYTRIQDDDASWDDQETLETIPFYPVFFDKNGAPVLNAFFTANETDPIEGEIEGDLKDVVGLYTVPVIDNWLAYVDDKAYSGTLSLINEYGDVIDKITITFTKKLPTSAPKGYSTKTNQVIEGLYKSYLVPETWVVTEGDPDENGNPTYNGAMNGTMPMLHVFNLGTSDKDVTSLAANYEITFAASAIAFKDGKPVVVDVTVAGDEDLVINRRFIDNKTKHATTVEYNYGLISTKLYDSETDTYADYKVVADKFDTEFHDIYDNTYSWHWATREDLKLKKDDPMPYKTEVKYGAGSGETNDDPEFTVELQYILGVSTIDGKYNAPLSKPYENSLLVTDAALISNSNNKEEYFDVTISGTTLTFVPELIDAATNPKANVASTLVINVVDMYTHTTHVVRMPMTVLKR